MMLPLMLCGIYSKKVEGSGMLNGTLKSPGKYYKGDGCGSSWWRVGDDIDDDDLG